MQTASGKARVVKVTLRNDYRSLLTGGSIGGQQQGEAGVLHPGGTAASMEDILNYGNWVSKLTGQSVLNSYAGKNSSSASVIPSKFVRPAAVSN